MSKQTSSVRQGKARDSVTILMTAPGHTASKRFVKTAVAVEKIDFNAGLYFAVMEPQVVGDIFGLSDVLMAVESFPNMLVIRGVPADDAFVGNWVRRKGSGDVGNFFTPPAGHHWLLIDFDKIKIPKHLSLKRNPAAVCEYLVGLLPAEFHGATYHWQMSSSAGVGANDVVSMHIWFWLMRPVPDQDLKAWGTAVNHKVGYKLIDTALFQHVQAHYTAAPTFEGMANPFPMRSGLVTKASASVDLILPAAAVHPVRQPNRTGSALAVATGFEAKLALIGDHPGGEGFHAPIVAALASYVGTHGEQGTDREALYQAVRQRVISADARNHDPAYVEHMASREHIMPAIESAIRKYGTAPARRKASLHDGVQPHFQPKRTTVEDAQRQLAEIAKLAF